MTTQDKQQKKLSDELYRKYGRPLELQHSGKYLAIFPDGRTLLADSLLEAAQKAKEAFGPGSFLFRVGTKAVGKWR